jgi:hypothetical protein
LLDDVPRWSTGHVKEDTSGNQPEQHAAGTATIMQELFDQRFDTRHVLPPWFSILLVTSFWIFLTAAILWATFPIRAKVYTEHEHARYPGVH